MRKAFFGADRSYIIALEHRSFVRGYGGVLIVALKALVPADIGFIQIGNVFAF